MAEAHAVHKQVREASRLDDRDAAESHEDYAETVDAEDVPHGEKDEDGEDDTLRLGADTSSRHNIASPQKEEEEALVGVRVLEDILQSRRPDDAGVVQDFLIDVVAEGAADNFLEPRHKDSPRAVPRRRAAEYLEVNTSHGVQHLESAVEAPLSTSFAHSGDPCWR